MRKAVKAAFTLTATAVLATAISATGAPVLAAAMYPIPQTVLVFPQHHGVTAVATDAELIRAAAPERAILAGKAAAAASAAAASAAAASAAASAAATVAAQAKVVHRAAVGSGGGATTLNIWTTGFQTEVNACRGGVDMTAHYGTRIVAEHWSCGGRSFPTSSGSVVTFTGLDAGTYRVIGIVATLDAYVAHTSQVPHGYAMLFQTCRGGDSHYTEFIALSQIG